MTSTTTSTPPVASAPQEPRSTGAGARRRRLRDLRFALLMAAPALVVIVLLLGYPMGYALYVSGFDWNDKIPGDRPFVGLGNYVDLLGDGQVHRALGRTLLFAAVTVLGGVGMAVLLAVLLNVDFRGRTLARVLLLVPWAVPPVVNGIMWKLIFDGATGVVNAVGLGLGLFRERVQFLADPQLTMNVLIFAEMWKLLPFLTLLMLAGLQGIPANVYKAARIDGASPWQQFVRVTVPNLRGPILFALVVQTMWSLKVFDTIFVLTGGSGGPAEGTTTLSFLTYLVSFSNLDRGYGAAIAVASMVLVLAFALLWVLLLRDRHKEGVR
ncbi:sugar ABC transporter permease [Desertihabitans brevis]|uniref:Sugar ABC transporter permease n=1 Tax=Desertihabitans brevis TaxID=2268447 RepID=A0A367YTY2_9ACTN|nr:sugar ABC transporter permease [Desertihabitans brevis]RCK69353.1 sugar ABC transporter permease [Desertihabitans brevis]